jgi:hypothetical protein
LEDRRRANRGVRMRSRPVAVVVALAVSVLVSGTASAQTAAPPPPPPPPPGVGTGGQGWQNSQGNGVTVGAQSGSSAPGSSSGGNVGRAGGGGGASNCTWTPAGSQDTLSGYDQAGNIISGGGGQDSAGNVIQPGVKGTWYAEICGGQYVGSSFVPTGAAPPAVPVVSPAMLANQARSQLAAAAPHVQMSPPSTSDPSVWQYARFPTWVWLSQWGSLHATAAVPGVTVTATATPVQLVLSYEDGPAGTKVVTCNGPGTPYSDGLASSENPDHPVHAASPDCGWTWDHTAVSSADQKFEVTAHVVYDVAWTVAGAPGGGPLPPINSATSTYRVTVGQIEALVTGGQ